MNWRTRAELGRNMTPGPRQKIIVDCSKNAIGEPERMRRVFSLRRGNVLPQSDLYAKAHRGTGCLTRKSNALRAADGIAVAHEIVGAGSKIARNAQT